MSAQYTPGPWAFVHCDDHEIDVGGSWSEDGDGYVVTETAIVGSEDGSLAIAVIGMNWPNNWDSETVDANVKLVAAAPDLLESSITLLAVCDDPARYEERPQAFKALADAIAKATSQ